MYRLLVINFDLDLLRRFIKIKDNYYNHVHHVLAGINEGTAKHFGLVGCKASWFKMQAVS